MSSTDTHELLDVQLSTGTVKLLSGGCGDPIMFLHHSWGNPGWSSIHENLAQHFRVIVPDMPGWGGSERPMWARDTRDIAILVGRVIDTLEVEGVSIVGLGYGGFVAVELASMSPGRLNKLVLIGPAGLKPKEGDLLDQMLMAHRQYITDSFRDRDSYVSHFGEEPTPEMRELWDHSREMTARVSWKPYLFNRRLEPLIEDINIPTLLIWGEQDNVVPTSVSEQFSSAMGNASAVIVPNAGHVVEIEEPETVAQLIREHIHNN